MRPSAHFVVTVACGAALGVLFAQAASCVLGGCASPQTITKVSNDARNVGEAASEVLHEKCTVEYDKAENETRLNELDVYCLPAEQAYDLYRAAWATLVAEVQIAQATGQDGPELAHAAKDVVRAAEELAAAMDALSGAQ